MSDQTPDTHTDQCHANADNTAADGGNQRNLGLRLEVDLLNKQRAGDDGQCIDHQYPTDNPHHLYQQRLLEEDTDSRGSQEKNDIQHRTDNQVEKENSIVVHPAGIRFPNQCIRKTAVNNRVGYGNEYREDSHDAVFRWSQQTGQYQSY